MTRDQVVEYLKSLRDRIIDEFSSLETSAARFERTVWPYKKGHGGGEMSVIRNGAVFEKAAVNWSGVGGDVMPGGASSGESSSPSDGFFATGISIITHMRNPKMPTVHFNIRYIENGPKWWLGGGFDLTPMGFEFVEDTQHFHHVAERLLSPFGADLYPRFKQQAADYFYIKHYARERGVGGIFFDHYNTGQRSRDFDMWSAVGNHFLEAIMPIYRRRLIESYTEADRLTQLRKRAHYVEFNLLYDRGTKFGFESGGNPDAILCSMPPLAAW